MPPAWLALAGREWFTVRPVLITLMMSVATGLASQTTAPPRAPAIHDLLDAYWKGELDVVSRRFKSGRDIDAMLPGARAWVETSAARGWDIASAVLFLDLADAAIRLPDPSPGAAIQLVAWGRDEITRKRNKDEPSIDAAFEARWHRAAIGILQGAQAWRALQDYLGRVERRFESGVPGRVWLARGIAIDHRPPETAATPDARTDDITRALEQAVQLYDRAARDEGVRAEASARSANALVRLGRHRDALRRVDVGGQSPDDLAVAAWLANLRAQALRGLGEHDAARVADEQALSLDPGPGAESLARGDYRFVPAWLAALKADVPTSMTTVDGAPARPPVSILLDRYADGDHGFVEQSLVASESLEGFSDHFRKQADEWVGSGEPDDARRRQLIVAAVTLEAAYARGRLEWPHALLLLEWACTRLRQHKVPDDSERLWMRAASALMEGVVAASALEVHTTHALQRFEADGALTMARAVAAEQRAGPDDRTTGGTRAPTFNLDLAVTRLTQASVFPDYRHEAELRLGYTALRRGRAEDALGHLAAATESDDPDIRHLAHLFRGRALTQLERNADAVAAYRAARDVVETQTVAIALADALARAGQRADAAAMADRTLDRVDWPPDPWLSYGQSDFRHWSQILDELRRAVR